MHPKHFINPFYIFFLVLPYGISTGFATVTLPYLLIQKGFSVEMAATIVGLGFSANIWRFLWGPLADLTLTLRTWYWIGIIACALTLLLLCFISFNPKQATLLTVFVFISQVAATFVVLPVGGIMAHRVEEHKKGRAGGWYQAGNLGGVGLGGGIGLWLAIHYNNWVSGLCLCLLIVLFALTVLMIEDVKKDTTKNMLQQIKTMGKDLFSMVRIPILLFVIIVFCMPIGTGAATNLWSAIGKDWNVNGDTVALVTGILSGIIGVAGSIAGGWIADKWGVWWAYFGSGIMCALVTALMAAFPYVPNVYVYGVLAYGLALGLMNAAFSALALFATGKKAASTKYSLLSSLANIPVVYMTTFDGWMHDLHNSKYMLLAEALAGIAATLICMLVLKWLQAKALDKLVDY